MIRPSLIIFLGLFLASFQAYGANCALLAAERSLELVESSLSRNTDSVNEASRRVELPDGRSIEVKLFAVAGNAKADMTTASELLQSASKRQELFKTTNESLLKKTAKAVGCLVGGCVMIGAGLISGEGSIGMSGKEAVQNGFDVIGSGANPLAHIVAATNNAISRYKSKRYWFWQQKQKLNIVIVTDRPEILQQLDL